MVHHRPLHRRALLEGYLYRKSSSRTTSIKSTTFHQRAPSSKWVRSFFQLFDDRLVYTTTSGEDLPDHTSIIAGGGASSAARRGPVEKKKALHFRNIQFVRARSARYDNLHVDISYRNSLASFRGTDPKPVALWVRMLQAALQTYRVEKNADCFPDEDASSVVSGLSFETLADRVDWCAPRPPEQRDERNAQTAAMPHPARAGLSQRSADPPGGASATHTHLEEESASEWSDTTSTVSSHSLLQELLVLEQQHQTTSSAPPRPPALAEVLENVFEQPPGAAEDITICLERFFQSGQCGGIGGIFELILDQCEDWVEHQVLRESEVDGMLGREVRRFARARIWLSVYSWCLPHRGTRAGAEAEKGKSGRYILGWVYWRSFLRQFWISSVHVVSEDHKQFLLDVVIELEVLTAGIIVLSTCRRQDLMMLCWSDRSECK